MEREAILQEVRSWPVEDRLRLIDEVWDSISDTPEGTALSEAHRVDLRRRLDAYRDNPKAGSPWEEVEASLQGSGRFTGR